MSRFTYFYVSVFKTWVLQLKLGTDVPLPYILEAIYPFRAHNHRALGYSVLRELLPFYLTES